MENVSDFLSQVGNFFINKQRSLSERVWAAIILFMIVQSINAEFGFSYYYANARRVEQIEKLTNAIQVAKADTLAAKQLKKLRTELLDHNSLSEDLSFFACSITSIAVSLMYSISAIIKSPINNPPMSDFDQFMVNAMSVFILAIFAIWAAGTIFLTKDRIVQKIGAIILLAITSSFFGFILIFIGNILPIPLSWGFTRLWVMGALQFVLIYVVYRLTFRNSSHDNEV